MIFVLDFLAVIDDISHEHGDINNDHNFFSYEHFYVIYCKFFELDMEKQMNLRIGSIPGNFLMYFSPGNSP